MQVGNGEGWNGDWDGIETWVQGLYPNLLHDLEDEDGEGEGGHDWPRSVEVYVGSRTQGQSPQAQIDVSELEADDAASHVTLGIQDVLASQPEDRSTLVVKLLATHEDEEGDEVPWSEAGNIVRSFTRSVTVRPMMPQRVSPPAEPWQSPSTAPAPPPPAPSNLNGGGYGHGAPTGMAPSTPMGLGGVGSGRLGAPGTPGGGPHTPFTSPQTPNLGDQAMLFAFQSMNGVLHMLAGEHRFLVDQNAALMDRLIGVHETAIRASGAESRSARQSMEQMNRDVLDLHKNNVQAAAETERVRLEADKKSEERERRRAVDENRQLREALENALGQLNEAREAQTAVAFDPDGDPLRQKVAGAADQVLNAVLASLSGQGPPEGAPTNGAHAAPNPHVIPSAPQAPPNNGRRRRRPGSPGVRPVGGVPDPEPEPGGGSGGAGFDLNSVTPMQAAIVLKMLDPSVRKEALQALVGLDRELAIQFGIEAADAVDKHDGVIPAEGT